jgi:hypothetical protein
MTECTCKRCKTKKQTHEFAQFIIDNVDDMDQRLEQPKTQAAMICRAVCDTCYPDKPKK